uniref:Serine/threonine-protein kinase receptor n=1 Tax=Scleropages formosus TaxID=113540 RepID=A0A8C9RNP9_SCLFO
CLFPFLVSLVLTSTSKGRRCEFLARPSEVPKVRRAGHVNGTVQLCAYTDCCMGFFKLDGGQPRPDLLGCGMMNVQCPEPSCSASKHMDNYTKCVCSSDLCNANMTWMPQSEESQRSSSLDLWRLGMAAIALGTLLLVAVLYVAAQWRQLFKDPSKNPPKILTIFLIFPHECNSLLGQGSFASVWQACLDGTPVAVKAFPAAHAQKFIHERKVFELPLMEHSSLVQYLGAGRELRGGERVLVLELAEHGSLKNFLSLHTSDWRSSLKLAQFLTQGLAFLHSDLYRNGVHKPPVAHCDLSSSNVLVRSDGSCALCDFGCSTVLRSCSEQPSNTCPSRAHVGTLRYMSPEILEGYVNLQSGRGLMQGDVYSLGLLLWELWRRCSDLYRGDPVPEHHLPYEAELGPNPSLNDLLLFVSEKRERPLLPKEWERFSQVFSDMKDTLEDCWDHDPEARLTAQCAADRITALSLNCLQ